MGLEWKFGRMHKILGLLSKREKMWGRLVLMGKHYQMDFFLFIYRTMGHTIKAKENEK